MSNHSSKAGRSPVALALIVMGSAIVAPLPGFARGDLSDPTRPPNSFDIEELSSPAPASTPYELSAILVAKGRRVAVINGRPVQNGDQIMNAQVLSILRDKVILKASSGELTLRLLSTPVKGKQR